MRVYCSQNEKFPIAFVSETGYGSRVIAAKSETFMLSYKILEMKFGPVAAWNTLVEIEKAARIRSFEMAAMDPELRLAHACRVQDSLIASNSAA